MTTPIILDCDPGHDDAIALFLALARPELDLRLVTTVAGNGTLEKTTRNARQILTVANRTDVPVAAGVEEPLVRKLRTAEFVHGESGLDGPRLPEPEAPLVDRHAVEAIKSEIETTEDPVTLVPTGPLTNLGLLLSTYPELTEAIERIVLMGGGVAEGNVTPPRSSIFLSIPKLLRSCSTLHVR